MPAKDEATGKGEIVSESIKQCQMCKYFVKSGDVKASMGQCHLYHQKVKGIGRRSELTTGADNTRLRLAVFITFLLNCSSTLRIRFWMTLMDQASPGQTLGLALGAEANWPGSSGGLCVLEEHHLRASFISGCSAGALVAAFYASGAPVSYMREIGLRLNWRSLQKFTLPLLALSTNEPLDISCGACFRSTILHR